LGALAGHAARLGEQCRKFLNEVVVNFDETETFLTRNRIFMDRTQGVGVIHGTWRLTTA